MRLIHYIPGKDAPDQWLPGEVVRFLHGLYLHPPQSVLEWARLCCKAGLCPVVLTRSGLTYKAAS